MSALLAVQIVCDEDGCWATHTPTWNMAGSISEARREAHAKGWVSVGPRGNDRKDYCPKHAATGWSRYDACARCRAAPGAPCANVAYSGRNATDNARPHPGRRERTSAATG
jgi:hypothetical protein